MSFTLRYTPEAQEGLTHLARAGLKHLAERALLRIADDPYRGKRLVGKLSGIYAARITRRYRITYTMLPQQHVVVILDIAHRRGVYR